MNKRRKRNQKGKGIPIANKSEKKKINAAKKNVIKNIVNIFKKL